MRSITYFSTQKKPFSERDLDELQDQTSRDNEIQGITGMLLYKNGNFLQVIEGPDQAVEDLYLKIQADARHEDVAQVSDVSVEQRQFPDWSMGFKNLDKLVSEVIPGFTKFANPFSYDEFQKSPARAHRLLLFFAKNI